MTDRIPGTLQRHLKVAEGYLADGRIRDMEFSRYTYQVQVADQSTNKKHWAFIQLDPSGGILDRFCSCDVEDSSETCEHVAAAYLAIYGGRHRPLHRRFLESLWVKMTQLALEKLGDDPKLLKRKKEGVYGAGKVFTIEVKSKAGVARLQECLKPVDLNGDETSLKFANLTTEEMEAWETGNPPPPLRYELSFWAELAKWAMILEEFGTQPKITFEGKGLPNKITATIKGLSFSIAVEPGEWPRLLPTLVGRKNLPLEVRHLQEETIEAVTYDVEGRRFLVRAHEEESINGLNTGVVLGEWTFLEGRGFYCQEEHPLLGQGEISGDQVPYALTEFGPLLRRHLGNAEIHITPKPLSTHLGFDEEGNLAISSYLFEQGDMAAPGAALFDEWVYLPNEGFYRLDPEGEHYHKELIPRREVADYVTLNRGWFNSQLGFQTHLAQVEVYLTYTLDSADRLTFMTKLDSGEGGEVTFDFGRWLYIEGQGFFSKKSAALGSFLSAGATIAKEDIPRFIKAHHDELLHVRGFYCSAHPILKAKLKLVLERDNKVIITPQYIPLPEFRDKKLRVFHDVVHVEGEGFSDLPRGQILPKGYSSQHTISQKELPHFLAEDLPKLRPFLGEVDTRLQIPTELLLVVSGVGKSDKDGVIPLKLEVQSELGRVAVAQLVRAVEKKQRFVFSEAGLIDLHDQQFEWLRRIHSDAVDEEVVALSSIEVLRLDALTGLHLDEDISHPQLDLLLGKTKVEKPKTKGLRSELRPYQQAGVEWLWYLYRNHLSGLLCDDMGLGKTHQAMALMAAVRHKKKKARFLVVCPTSVLYHWQDKLEAFLPDIRVRTYYGTRRTLDRKGDPYDLILTSYGVIRRDQELIAEQKLEVVILDEIQVAKNHSSRVHGALSKLKGGMFLGLTGTPMENRLRELKSLFDIVLPGYMPGDAHYRNFFVAPIEKLQDSRRRDLLIQFIKPFLMRREKQEVLTELPEKVEDVAHCALSDDQSRLYQEVVARNAKSIREDLEDDSKRVSYVHIFALLSLLKQICNHPAIYEKNVDRYKEYSSGKFDLFCELLNEARDSRQKVVVFTQYLGMMDIIEAHLKEQGIGFAAIRGATRDRRKEMNRFQTDPNCEVFVGSLQASGVGIDLTAASVVIHYDRWWNPAREDQATDRVHRIGQTRGVQVFKLVTKGTLEERIDEIIYQKRALLKSVITTDEENVLKQLDRKALISLLKSVHA